MMDFDDSSESTDLCGRGGVLLHECVLFRCSRAENERYWGGRRKRGEDNGYREKGGAASRRGAI
jgi:hypothetical protein